jgi:S-DNA-T family DNA segregation ATPase FtsK/SpoIIIE
MKYKTFTKFFSKAPNQLYVRATIGCLIVLSSIVVMVSLISYNPWDPSWFYIQPQYVDRTNLLGAFGANIAGLFLFLWGCAAYFIPLYGLFLAYHYLRSSMKAEWDALCAAGIFIVCVAGLCSSIGFDGGTFMMPGGIIGIQVASLVAYFVGAAIAHIGLLTLACASTVIITRGGSLRFARGIIYVVQAAFSWEHVIKPCLLVCQRGALALYALSASLVNYFKRLLSGSMIEHDLVSFDFDQIVKEVLVDNLDNSDVVMTGAVEQSLSHDERMVVVQDFDVSLDEPVQNSVHPSSKEYKEYEVPGSSLFVKTKPMYRQNDKEYEVQARVLEEKLERFGISGKVVSIQSGPVITMFEYQPHIDSKISKIIALEDDLALALQAVSIRIIAPIPGKSVVGFEVAKKRRDDVLFSDIVHNKEFVDSAYQLPIILGCDTIGNPSVIDLVTTPHLLVAGSTGSGKSVALNAMLISLLCKHTPDDLNLILIDPKRLEFAAYADVAHLVFPIITEPRKAQPALQWVLKTMNERYELMAKCGARNISDYRARVQKNSQLTPMPWLVVVIDELSDLMMTTGKEVEELIARIAQMARAAGIHLIVATQRPSVDVITGLIKVNFPSRISFKVTSKVDSRTILDGSGAEKLLGRGDMLYMNAGSTLVRIHGAYVTHAEIEQVVSSIKLQREVQYRDLDIEVPANDTMLSEQDEKLYMEVVSFVKTIDDVSISLLQRRFRIGYNRSARIIEMLESDGYIMPADGSKTRKVIR